MLQLSEWEIIKSSCLLYVYFLKVVSLSLIRDWVLKTIGERERERERERGRERERECLSVISVVC